MQNIRLSILQSIKMETDAHRIKADADARLRQAQKCFHLGAVERRQMDHATHVTGNFTCEGSALTCMPEERASVVAMVKKTTRMSCRFAYTEVGNIGEEKRFVSFTQD